MLRTSKLKKMNSKIFIAILFCITLLMQITCRISFASDAKVYGHKSPDGTITFSAETIKRTNALFSNDYSSLYLTKVFPVKGSPYYYFYVYAADSKLRKDPVTHVAILVDDKPLAITPYSGFAAITEDKFFRGWYRVSNEIEKQLSSIEQISIELQSNDKVIKSGKFAAKHLKLLPAIEKEQYVREGLLLDEPKQVANSTVHPQLFIPGVSPETVQDALLYKAFFYHDKKGQEQRLGLDGYTVVKGSNPYVFVLEGKEDVGRSSGRKRSYITVTANPYHNGVWADINLSCVSITSTTSTSFGVKRTNYYSSIEDYSEKDFAMYNTSRYQKPADDLWANFLLETYYELYGRYDYGISWLPEKDKEGILSFKVVSVNKEKFPALGEINAGDKIIAVNDLATTYMKGTNLRYWLDANGKTATISFKDERNTIKIATIDPQFIPASAVGKSYKEAIAKIPPKYFKTGKGRLENDRHDLLPIEKNLFTE